MTKSEKFDFYNPSYKEEKMEYLPGGGGEYCKYGMDNAKQSKEKADALASYVKGHRPKGQ